MRLATLAEQYTLEEMVVRLTTLTEDHMYSGEAGGGAGDVEGTFLWNENRTNNVCVL